MSYDPSKSRELNRILWRQSLLDDAVGRAWLTEQAQKRPQPKERDLGPHRFVPGFSDRTTSNLTMGNG